MLAVAAGGLPDLLAGAAKAGVPARQIGVTGGTDLALPGSLVALTALNEAHEGWFPQPI